MTDNHDNVLPAGRVRSGALGLLYTKLLHTRQVQDNTVGKVSISPVSCKCSIYFINTAILHTGVYVSALVLTYPYFVECLK